MLLLLLLSSLAQADSCFTGERMLRCNAPYGSGIQEFLVYKDAQKRLFVVEGTSCRNKFQITPDRNKCFGWKSREAGTVKVCQELDRNGETYWMYESKDMGVSVKGYGDCDRGTLRF